MIVGLLQPWHLGDLTHLSHLTADGAVVAQAFQSVKQQGGQQRSFILHYSWKQPKPETNEHGGLVHSCR